MEGTIKNIVLSRAFGFIHVPGQPDVFFHYRDLDPQLELNEQLQERRVRFEIIEGDKGPRAKNVRAAD